MRNYLKKMKYLMFAILAISGILIFNSMEFGEFATLAMAVPVFAWMAEGGKFKELSAEAITKLTDVELAEYSTARNKHMFSLIENSIKEVKDGTISKDEYDEKQKLFLKQIKNEFTDMDRESLKEDLAVLKSSLIKTQLELKTVKQTAAKKEGNSFKSFLTNFFSKDSIKSFLNKPTGHTDTYEEKTVSITSDYLTGTALITEDSGRRIVPVERPLNMRDIMAVEQTDLPYVAYSKITGWVNSIDMLTENAALSESSFDVKEESVLAKRLGTFIDISKNMLKSVTWVISRIMNILPKKMRWIEDFEILFGDASGEHLDGLMKNARTFAAADVAFSAGAIASIATWNSGVGTVVTFAAAHNLYNGYNITFASSTNYNATYTFIVKSATQILLPTGTYAAETATSWTANANHGFKDAIVDANEYDALKTALSDANTQWYRASGIVINPMDATKIELLKSTTAAYLGVIQRRNGILYINNIPCVETDAMPLGEFLIGDFDSAVSLVDYQSLEIYLADDVTYIKANKVAVIVEEQIMLPIYNSLMFLKGKYATVIANIDKP